MSLLGLDVGTTGVKAIAFSNEGQILAQAYQEYNVVSPQKGWAEFDSQSNWEKIKSVIAQVARQTRHDPHTASTDSP